MGILDRFRDGIGVQREIAGQPSADDQAIARYRYLLRTAPPETIEQTHAEAFAQLTPVQRRSVLQELSAEMPEAERAAAIRGGDDADALARTATRAELRQPGAIERAFGAVAGSPAAGGAPGFGSLMARSFISSMAGTVIGSMLAQHFFSSHPDASHWFADNADHTLDSSSAGLIDDPFTHAGHGTADPGDVTSDDGGDFDTGDDVGGFDVGDSFDV